MTLSADSIAVRIVAPAWLFLCLVLGGSSSGGIVANGLLQIGGGAIVLWLAATGGWSGLPRHARLPAVIAVVAAVLTLVMLMPLPPGIWTRLGGRGAVFDAYALIGMDAPWLPGSLVPDATLATLFALLPPLAMFGLVHVAPPAARRATVAVLVVVAFASVIFGVVQQVAGYRSDTYIYEYTSRGGAVGFFANRNHLATLCLMTMPFLAALAAIGQRASGGSGGPGAPAGWVPAAGALVLLAVGTITVQSLAGWILLLPTLLGCALVFRRPRRGAAARALVPAIVIVVAITVVVALFAPVSSADFNQLSGEVRPQERRAIMGLTWKAVSHFAPFGTGWGSFADVYRQFEDHTATTGGFVNHAHNDYLELLLEAGVSGLALLAAFAVWWVLAIRDAWRSGGDPLARAATVAIGVVVAHSVVDYPIRTAAIACVAALCAGLAGTRTAPQPDDGYGGEPSGGRRGIRRERTVGTIMLGASARPTGRPSTRIPSTD